MIVTYDIVADFSVRRYRSKEFARRYRCTAISWQTDQLHTSSCRSSHTNMHFAFHTGDKQEYDTECGRGKRAVGGKGCESDDEEEAREPADGHSAATPDEWRLHQRHAGRATGVSDPLQWWRLSSANVPHTYTVTGGSPHHVYPGQQRTVSTPVQHGRRHR